ncbi:MerR family transcriptional regulator [Priestia endophytica]|uniref:MerR family transcriptional regulator n=1 Tax=Priestia endophytica TaxID=135735 RepID=UPI00227EB421|nr:MerR family transcriptional regulator [Priestia endophytica]MCY8235308.1 MerR family transcriptional regulator [Priestia endophytica]
MKQHFSIGETARLNNISIQTLRYYDRIGIFKPNYINPQTGYRYYHVKQFFYLDVIKYLKYIRTPLEEIRNIISCTPEHMQTFLAEQENVIEHEIEKLERARRLLQRRKNQLKEQLEICRKKEEGLIYFRHIEKQTILKVETTQVNPHDQPDLHVRKLSEVLEEKGDMVDNHYGCIYDLKSYKNSYDIYYTSIYTTIPKEEQINIVDKAISLDTISSGEYVCISFDWSTEYYNSYYQKLYRYIESNGIQTEGEVYEVSLPINYSSLREEQFLTELRVLTK